MNTLELVGRCFIPRNEPHTKETVSSMENRQFLFFPPHSVSGTKNARSMKRDR